MAAPASEDGAAAGGGFGAAPGSRPCPRRARQLLHMSVLSQSPSPCGRFLAAGNDYGEVAVFGLAAALGAEATEATKRPLSCFRGEATPPGGGHAHKGRGHAPAVKPRPPPG